MIVNNIFLIILESLRFRLIAKIVKGKHLEIPGFHIISVYHTCFFVNCSNFIHIHIAFLMASFVVIKNSVLFAQKVTELFNE